MRLQTLPIFVLLAVACHPQGSGDQVGAPTARGAVETFLAAARSQDIRAMSNVFGNEDGLVRDDMERREHEMRMLSLMCFLNHDEARIVSESAGETRRFLAVDLARGPIRKQVTITTVVGAEDRWYVSVIPVDELEPFCRAPNTPPAGSSPAGTR